MPTILNPSFEDGANGAADNWTQAQTCNSIRINGFTATPNDKPHEDFEQGYNNNEDYFFEFILLAAAAMSFEAGTNPEDYEDFEEEWSANQSYLFEFVSSVLSFADLDLVEADPDLGNADRFEHSWSNDAYEFTLGSVSTADLDPSTGGTADTMENDWDNNVYDTVLGASSTADFDGTAAEAYEDFEEVKLIQSIVSVDPATDTVTLEVGQSLNNGERVQFHVENGQPPAGINVSAKYYVVNAVSNTFKVSATSGGAAVDITDTGTGDIFITPDKSLYWVEGMSSI